MKASDGIVGGLWGAGKRGSGALEKSEPVPPNERQRDHIWIYSFVTR